MKSIALKIVPIAALALAGAVALVMTIKAQPSVNVEKRQPGAVQEDALPPVDITKFKLTTYDSKASGLPGDWPCFRGPLRDGISHEAVPLARTWPKQGPKKLWEISLGDGYASPAVLNGRLYVLDYIPADKPKGIPAQDALRCLSLDDGKEIWRASYPIKIPPFHGMSRTIPAVTDKYVVSFGPLCHVLCVDAKTGEFKWFKDLNKEYGTKPPEWYAGQCPLIDGDKVILAPSGTKAVMVALDLASGKEIWKTPNPHPEDKAQGSPGWTMTHTSIATMEFDGRKMFVYSAGNSLQGGIVGVDSATGTQLWESNIWGVPTAAVATPICMPDGRTFFSGGYNAGCMMARLVKKGEGYELQKLWRLPPDEFGAAQQTPILYQDHIIGMRPDGHMACLDLDGKVAWISPSAEFGQYGPYMIAGDLLFIMDDMGKLTLAQASTSEYKQLAQAKVLSGHESWGPMTLVGGRLLVRDFNKMACLDVTKQ